MTPEEMEGIRAALYRYALAVDTSDETLLAESLGRDVVLHRVDGTREGVEAVLAFYRTVFEGPTVWSKHLVSNVRCTRDRDGGFDVRAYFQAVSRTDDSGVIIFGEYVDRVARDRDGIYRIAVKNIDVQQTFPLDVPRA